LASPVPSPSPSSALPVGSPSRPTRRGRPHESSQERRLRATVDEIRADVQALRAELVDILEIEKPNSAGGRAELEREVRDAADALASRPLDAYRERLANVLPGDGSALHAAAGDTVRKFLNALDRAYRAWPRETATAREAAADAVAALDDAILQAGYLTIPYRLDEKLAAKHVGEHLDFASEFGDQLSSPEQCTKLLRWLGEHPRGIQGLVDLRNGRIYRMSQTRGGRIARVGVLVWAPLLSALVLWAVSRLGGWFDLDSWPSTRSGRVILLYLLVLAGALVHIGITKNLITNIRFDAPLRVHVPSHGLRWLELRWVAVGMLFLPVLVTAGLLWAAGLDLSDNQDLLTALLAGYSADSLFAAALTRFATTAKVQQETIVARLA
jgi:hypothetical protein